MEGIRIKIRKPQEDNIPSSFFVRKGSYAIPFQAVCDSNYIFLYASGLCGGATHDALANSVSSFMEQVEKGLLGDLYSVASDEAYPESDDITVPFPPSTLSE